MHEASTIYFGALSIQQNARGTAWVTTGSGINRDTASRGDNC